MFNTFVGVETKETDPPASGKRREVVQKACEECRRRKTKCSGECPCSGCVACAVKCVFPEFRRRKRRLRERAIASSKEESEIVLKQLFGDSSVQSLKGLSRDALLQVIQSREGKHSPATTSSPSQQGEDPKELSTLKHYEDAQLQDASFFDSGEAQSWYIGIPGATAAMNVLETILPGPLQETESPLTDLGHRLSHPPMLLEQPRSMKPSYHQAQRLIDAYFAHIHVFAPVIHEPSFRAEYLDSHSTKDPSWLALLNMVFALGSIATSPHASEDDTRYYSLARKYLPFESFGSNQLETLQALILMGGVYLPYRNRPGMASAIIGASSRVAHSLGLPCAAEGAQGSTTVADELKRRNWWTLYVLDVWVSMSLGRPLVTFGAFPELPRNILDDQTGELPLAEPTIHSPLLHNIQLCRMIALIHEHTSVTPLTPAQITQYDTMLLSWFHNLPPFLRYSDPCTATPLHDAHSILKWRLTHTRLLLHQPLLLDMSRRHTSIRDLPADSASIVGTCRELALESILSIQSERSLSLSTPGFGPGMSMGIGLGTFPRWNGVRFLFHACLVLLLALAIEPVEGEEYQNWVTQLDIGISLVEEMDPDSNPRLGNRLRVFQERLFMGAVTPPSQVVRSPVYEGVVPSFHVMAVDYFQDGIEAGGCFGGSGDGNGVLYAGGLGWRGEV